MSEEFEEASEELEELKERYLQIARLLAQGTDISQIAKELKVSGKTIGDVKKLIDNKFISIDSQGRPLFIRPIEEAEMFLDTYRERKEGRQPRKTTLVPAAGVVRRTVEKTIAQEAEQGTEQYLTLGKAIWTAVAEYLSKKGVPVSQFRENPPHRLIIEALQKAEQFDRMVDHVQQLEATLKIYEDEIDPMIRLRKALELLNKYVELGLVNEVSEEVLGIPLLNMKALSLYYSQILHKYLAGMTD